MSFENKIAVVTGGARGLGRACAEVLAEQGATVAIADVLADEAAATAADLGNGAVSIACDISQATEIEALFERVEADLGTASVLVNNAGIALPGEFLELDPAQFRQVIDVNLIGTFLASQRAAKAMVAAGIKGAIVNMSSINAQVAIPAIAAYCASKGGIMQLTKSVALALAPHGIRVNAVGPGSIDTEMLRGVNENPEAMQMVLSRTPLGRIGQPREIGEVVAFLASDKASYITGETVYVDGGRLGLNYTV
ncbi:MAG: SDR family NAD(P)-dependent oxidoreductase [Alphaproteobacteria bacterium]|jgi:NAD(P)-dependent dehydrogenase (short-subunit alcohol dehydrogenase family)|nr:SDR family NAD(P)-dependent oxidoreductase [Alphaproteobacteria bacterium]MDP6815422.1 SDR family NAD(P)-dependent oxidoreductase [Alphaproteobacteria bacterium]|tara:strand:+ start:165 stop:920 length:756 start_codon:yes stop_codon:yes gene_type:complete